MWQEQLLSNIVLLLSLQVQTNIHKTQRKEWVFESLPSEVCLPILHFLSQSKSLPNVADNGDILKIGSLSSVPNLSPRSVYCSIYLPGPQEAWLCLGTSTSEGKRLGAWEKLVGVESRSMDCSDVNCLDCLQGDGTEY